MGIKATDVAKLRAMTGAGMMAAKKALTETAGDFDKAIDVLRKSGAAKAAKKAGRETSEGRVHCYTHSNGKIGVVVEVLCETDFVARNEIFIEFCHDLAMHIAAMNPLYLSREDVPEEVLAKEKEIVQGKIEKWYEEVCLLDQPFVKDEDMTIVQLVEQKVLSLGENIRIGRFRRIAIGA